MNNRYTASTATPALAMIPAAVYSPNQAASGALLGGPVGLVYFLYRNFVAMGNTVGARNCLIFGALLIPSLLIILSIVPENFPSSPFTLFYVIVARFVAGKYQLTKEAIATSPEYAFQSNWNVIGAGLLCLVGSVIVIIGPIFALLSLGLIS
jgi:hypothetical protein